MMHWATDYIGRPWAKDGEGPDAFSCGGLIRAVYRQRLGVEIPVVDVDALNLLSAVRALRAEETHRAWTPIEIPAELDGVELSLSHDPHHVGLWLEVDGGGVLHAVQGIGVIFSSPSALKISGWNIKGFWRHQCKL